MTQIRKEQAYVLRAYWTKISSITASSTNPSNTIDVTADVATSSITNLPTGDATYTAPVRGIITSPSQPNFVKVRDNKTRAPIIDTVSGEAVYGKITYVGITYILSFLYNTTGGVATPATFASTVIDILIPEVMYFHEVRPNVAILDEGGFVSTTLLSANTQGWSDVLAIDPTSGANNPSIDSGQKLLFPGTSTYYIDNNSTNGLKISGTNTGSATDNISISTAQTAGINSGNVDISSGIVTGVAGRSGNISVVAGASASGISGGDVNVGTSNVTVGVGDSGIVNITTGSGSSDGNTGNVVITSGAQTNVLNSGAVPGFASIAGGYKSYGSGTADGALIKAYGGSVDTGRVKGGDFVAYAGYAGSSDTSGGYGGRIYIESGDGYMGGGDGYFRLGRGYTGRGGSLYLSAGLSDRVIGGDITISSGGTNGNTYSGDVSGSGNIQINTPDVSTGNGSSGGIAVETGDCTVDSSGSINIITGNSDYGSGGNIYIGAGYGSGLSGSSGGNVTMMSGLNTAANGNPGDINIISGNNFVGLNRAGDVIVRGGQHFLNDGYGGNIYIYGGDDIATNGNGGDIWIQAGQSESGYSGNNNSPYLSLVSPVIGSQSGSATLTSNNSTYGSEAKLALGPAVVGHGAHVELIAGTSTSAVGGNVTITGGAVGSSQPSGNVSISTSNSPVSPGTVSISAGHNSLTGSGGPINITTGDGVNGGGIMTLTGGDSTGSGVGGTITLASGPNSGSSKVGCQLQVIGATPVANGYVSFNPMSYIQLKATNDQTYIDANTPSAGYVWMYVDSVSNNVIFKFPGGGTSIISP